MLGRIEDSLGEVQRTRELDPLSLAKTSLAWRTYYDAHQYGKAIEVLQNAADMDPSFIPAYDRMILIYEQSGELDKAIEALQPESAFDRDQGKEYARRASILRKAYTAKGARGYWLQQLEFIGLKTYFGDAIFSAVSYTRLGRKDDAFRCLDKP